MTATLSPSLDPQQLTEALNWRYATKKFDATKKIDDATWAALEDALLLSPSSYGLQPWKFLVIQNPEVRRLLRPVSWNQAQVEDASHLVVFLHRTDLTAEDVDRHLRRVADVRGVALESLEGYRQMMIGNLVDNAEKRKVIADWTARQAYIAFGTFMTAAALMGVDACPMEGLDPKAYDRILGLEGSGYATVAACPAGYRAADDKYAEAPKVRFEKSEIIRTVA